MRKRWSVQSCWRLHRQRRWRRTARWPTNWRNIARHWPTAIPPTCSKSREKALWAEKRGPKNASLEQCDLGLGPGKLEGAYAQLPRYFKDTGKVMDVESRLVHCMVTLQGFKQEEVTRQWFSKPGKESDIEALVTFIGAKSNGKPINVPAAHPEEAEDGQDRRVHLLSPFRPAGFFLCHLPRPGRQAHPPAGAGQPDDQGGRRVRR
jgi:hypothetical protein